MKDRYIRQANIFALDGQELLRNTKVLIVGAGGLGNIVSSYLVAAGIREITIIDNDVIEITNLTRQICYYENDCGVNKVITLKRHLQALNSEANIKALDIILDKTNVDGIISTHDVIIDCSDNFSTKYLVSDISNIYQKPLITASIDGFLGQVMVLNTELCYRCIFPDANSDTSCFDGDVIGSSVGIIASYQANEALKLITKINTQSKLIQIDCLNNTTTQYNLSADMDCINNHSLELDTNNQPQCLTMLEAIKLIGTHGLKILDMRKNTLNHSGFKSIPFDLNMITELDDRKKQHLAVLCSYGYRSKLAAMRLVAIGYENVYYIEQS